MRIEEITIPKSVIEKTAKSLGYESAEAMQEALTKEREEHWCKCELDTETYIANTPRKVTIDYLQHRVFATGMRAYFKEDRLQLLSDVNGKFLP